MPKTPVAVQLASLRLPFIKALHTAAELGADAVEIDARGECGYRNLSRTGLRQLRKTLNDLNMRVCAVTYRTRRGYHVTDQLDERIDGTKLAMRFAFELGARIVVNQIGRIPDEPQGPEWSTLVESLSEIGQQGQRLGATLAAVTGGEDGASLAKLIDALPAGSLGVTFDPGNLIMHGFSASSSLASLSQHVIHVHARDAFRDLARGRGVEASLGEGSVDFVELLGVLEERGYRGCFCVAPQQSEDPVRDTREAIRFLREL